MITVLELIKELYELYKKHGNVHVVYATDEEGNDFRPIECAPGFHRKLEGQVEVFKNIIVVN